MWFRSLHAAGAPPLSSLAPVHVCKVRTTRVTAHRSQRTERSGDGHRAENEGQGKAHNARRDSENNSNNTVKHAGMCMRVHICARTSVQASTPVSFVLFLVQPRIRVVVVVLAHHRAFVATARTKGADASNQSGTQHNTTHTANTSQLRTAHTTHSSTHQKSVRAARERINAENANTTGYESGVHSQSHATLTRAIQHSTRTDIHTRVQHEHHLSVL